MLKKHVFGLTPWGQYFIQAMERLADTGRLDRGRSYAANGAVENLLIENGRVQATVAGSYQPYYTVTIQFKALNDAAVQTVKAEFARDALLYARIASGEFPDSLSRAMDKAAITLVPKKWAEIQRLCTCPDSGDPCKHQAAVYYLIAQEIDRDPFVLFRLRGVELGDYGGSAAKNNSVIKKVPLLRAFKDEYVQAWQTPDIVADPLAGIGHLENYAAAIPAMLPPSRGIAPFDMRIVLTSLYHAAAASSLLYRASDMEGARARSFASAHFEIHFDDPQTVRILSPLLPRRKKIMPIAAMFLSCHESDGSPSYRFLRAFASALASILCACAFVPDVVSDGASAQVVWKAARFYSDVDSLLSALECIAVAPASYGQSKKVPSRRVFIDRMMSAFITEFVRSLNVRLPVRHKNHPAVQALLLSSPKTYTAPGERGLPAALDAWLTVFDLAHKHPPLELTVKKTKGGLYTLEAASNGVPLMMLQNNAEAFSFVALLSNFVPAMAALGGHTSVPLDEKTLANFVIDAAPLLRRFGTTLVMPKELTAIAKPKAALAAVRTGPLVTYLDIASAVSFDWTVAIGDERLSIDEFSKLVSQGRKLVLWRGTWVRIDPLEAAAIMSRITGPQLKLAGMDAVRTILSGDVETDDSVRKLIENLFGAAGKDDPLPIALNAVFRAYQERGCRWILGNFARGFGCLLADDMGLGKTLQTIAVIQALKESGSVPAGGVLICAPASLLSNWEKEFERFAPALSLCVYYGSKRVYAKADVTLSTYETWIRDHKKFSHINWELVVLDEAHYIKNPASARAAAVKTVRAKRRLALTGTPVENNLTELWSIFDFVLPGYLSSLSAFTEQFRRPIELGRSAQAADRLKRITAPFILRRLKTDPAICGELPSKVAVNEYAALTPEQAALYQAVASAGFECVKSADKGARLGAVLALITALKQVANHPRNYDKESLPAPERSGKTRLLVALLESMFEAGERVLVFTQYVEMLTILETVIRDGLGVQPYILHGGLSKKKRDEAVNGFQNASGPGVFLISLRAGGVGLNLTAASRVIHYDLWFNPAVENQATDRAFRIGQTKNVFVHRLITEGTIEEHIDAIIQSKRRLADMTLRVGESWIANLNDTELQELIELKV